MNDLSKIEKNLRTIAKRYKSIKYSLGLAILFSMMGVSAFCEEDVTQEAVAQQDIMTTEQMASSREKLKNSVESLQSKINTARVENEKALSGLRLELVQLMEQGNQVIKTPWASWQFGANYMYSKWNGAYHGRNDKDSNIGIIERDPDIFNSSVSKSSKKYSELSLKKRANPYKLISIKEITPPIKDFKFNPVFSLKEPTKLEPLNLNINIASPKIPDTFMFSTSTPSIPTINPIQVNIETVTLVNYGNAWNRGIIGQSGTVRQRSLFVVPNGTYTLDNSSLGLDGNYAPTVIDMSITGQSVKVNNGTVININKSAGRAVSIDIDTGWVDWAGNPETSSTFTNEGTINLNAVNTAAIEAQTETAPAPYKSASAPASTNGYWIAKKEIYGINSGRINGNNNKQVAMTFVREQAPGVEKQFLTNAEQGIITMNGNNSMGFSFNVDDLYAEAKNEGKIILNGKNNYGFAFGKGVSNNHLKQDSVISNEAKGTIEINGNNSGGFALEEMINASKIAYVKNINITNKGKININSKESFGMYSEQMKAINIGEININENAVSSIGLYSTKKNTVNTELVNKGKINIKSKKDKNIALFTDSAKVTNDTDGIVDVLDGENIGAFISGTGVGENIGKIFSVADGSIAVLTKDSGNFINKGEIRVNAKTSSTNNGVIGILANTGSSFTNSNGKLYFNVSGRNSIGIYSKGNVKIGESDITATDNAINFFTDTNGLIEVESGKIARSTTKNGALLFFDGNSNGKIKLSGNLRATIEGGKSATAKGTAFFYRSSSAPVSGSIVGYNNTISYGTFTQAEVQQFFDNTFGTGALGSSTLNNLELTMKKDSRLFISPNVKAKISQLVTGNLFSGIIGAPVISSSSSDEYIRNLLLKSELEIDRPVDLDLATETYNNLEISNSSIINNNIIKGTKTKQYGMVQENYETNRAYVTLLNNQNKKIILSGNESLGIYAKNGYILNKGEIELGGNSSTAIYGMDNTLISNTNTSKIKLSGNDSIGIYYNNNDTSSIGENIENYGQLELNGSKDIGIAYNSKSISSSTPTLVKNFSDIKINKNGSIGIYSKILQNRPYIIENQGNIIINYQGQDKKNSAIGIHTEDVLGKIVNRSNGNIRVSKNNIGILGNSIDNQGKIEVDTAGIGIYSNKGDVNLQSGNIVLKGGSLKNETIGVLLNGSNQSLNRTGGNLSLEDYSYAVVNNGSANTMNLSGNDVTLKNNSVFAYSNDINSKIYNNVNLKFAGNKGQNLGIYSNGLVENNANIDLRKGYGNIGIYSNGKKAKNNGTISVGASDIVNNLYNIGMAAGFTDGHSPMNSKDTIIRPKYIGEIENSGTINVEGEFGIGLFATGKGSIARNTGNITLNNDNTVGIYADEGAIVYNSGNIATGKSNLKDVQGIILGVGSKLYNTGNITINAIDGVGVRLKGGTIENYGNIVVNGAGSSKVATATSSDMSLNFSGLEIKPDENTADVKIYKDKKLVKPVVINYNEIDKPRNVSSNSIGIYFNTSGEFKQNPIKNLSVLTDEADMIIGVEAAKRTQSKYIEINDENILKPYRETIMYNPKIKKWNIYSGSLTWIASAVLDKTYALPQKVYLAKIPYTTFAGNDARPVDKRDTYNFLDGLEQRYGVEALGTSENKIFQKLNSIGNNEEILFYQAIDEMMGHQYANVQQRVQATGNILDKEFDYLRSEWQTTSKDSNKIKTFGTNGEYKTNTAGVIDYKNNAYGVAYVHENENIKLGQGIGWYSGMVNNTFKFKDIGNSKEEMLQAKVGAFKSIAFDDNNSLNWTISGDIFAGYNKMNRKFLVVDEVFNAKAKYHIYGIGLKNEIGKEFRLSESFSIRPYGALKLEYGRIGKIREKSGEIKLEVKQNDYVSVKPEVGAELGYKYYFGTKSVRVGLGVAYENELGRVANGKNKARVANTTADWFNIRGEKEDRKGNVKIDLNIGVDNAIVGVTGNVGYDTKGENLRGGLGLRVIF